MLRHQEISGPEWDAGLARFRDVAHEQTHAYAAARWGHRRVRCLLVEEDGEPIGGALAVGMRLPVAGAGFSIVKFGPLIRQRAGEASCETVRKVAGELRAFFCTTLSTHLTVVPPAPAEGDDVSAALAHCGFAPTMPLRDARRYLIDLALARGEQRANLAGRWRRNLRQAEERRFDMWEANGPEGLRVFETLFEALRQRKQGVHAAGLDEMDALMASPTPGLRPRIFVASFRHYPIAAAVVSCIGARATYLFGAQTEQGASGNASYALQMHVIDTLSMEGRARWYDLGGDNDVPGLKQFKTGLVGTRGRVAAIPTPMTASGGAFSDLLARAAVRLKPLG